MTEDHYHETYTEAYSESFQASKVERFPKLVNDF